MKLCWNGWLIAKQAKQQRLGLVELFFKLFWDTLTCSCIWLNVDLLEHFYRLFLLSQPWIYHRMRISPRPTFFSNFLLPCCSFARSMLTHTHTVVWANIGTYVKLLHSIVNKIEMKLCMYANFMQLRILYSSVPNKRPVRSYYFSKKILPVRAY